MQQTQTTLVNIKKLDSLLDNLKKDSYIIMAGKPGAGAITLASRIAFNISVRQNLPTLYFSLKNTAAGVTKDMMDIAKEEGENCKTVSKAPFFVQDDSEEITNIQEQIQKNNIKFVVIDSLNLVAANQKRQISSVSDSLKSLAKECQIQILAVVATSEEWSNELEADAILKIQDWSSDGIKLLISKIN